MKNKLKNTYHGTYGNIKRKKNNIMVYFEGYSTDKSYPKKSFIKLRIMIVLEKLEYTTVDTENI